MNTPDINGPAAAPHDKTPEKTPFLYCFRVRCANPIKRIRLLELGYTSCDLPGWMEVYSNDLGELVEMVKREGRWIVENAFIISPSALYCMSGRDGVTEYKILIREGDKAIKAPPSVNEFFKNSVMFKIFDDLFKSNYDSPTDDSNLVSLYNSKLLKTVRPAMSPEEITEKAKKEFSPS